MGKDIKQIEIELPVKVKRSFRRPYIHPDELQVRSDKGGGKVMTETAGYVDKTTQLRMLISSGESLEAYYKKLFPEMERQNEPEPEFDPTVQKGYDFFDYHEDVTFVKNALRRSEKEAQHKAEFERLKAEQEKAKENSPEPKEPPAVEQ